MLVSGDGLLPSLNPGRSLPIFDGLRCVGFDFRRHGSRIADPLGDTGVAFGHAAGPGSAFVQRNQLLAGKIASLRLVWQFGQGDGHFLTTAEHRFDQRLWRPFETDPAVDQKNHPIGQRSGLMQIMGGE